MPVSWQKQQNIDERAKKQELFLPPDEDNFEKHGISNLVIKFNDEDPLITLDKDMHKLTPFFRKKMLEGVLDKFLEEINKHVEPIRE
jgi:hypothetical protein